MIKLSRVALALLVVVGVAHAGPYAPADRTAHLSAALAELRALGPDGRRTFERTLHDGIRTACRTVTTACLADVARRTCGNRAGCLAAADVVVTNEHAETDLVDELTRVRLVRTSADYHAAILGELRGRQALLAAELALTPPGDLAARIDRFCGERDREVHRCAPGDRGCVPSLPYQRCAAGLVWYIATDGAP